MSKIIDDFLLEWKSDARFELFLEEVLKLRPDIPSYNPSEDNTETWKAECQKREGFDIWLKSLKIRL